MKPNIYFSFILRTTLQKKITLGN